jgi:hypothetical protein
MLSLPPPRARRETPFFRGRHHLLHLRIPRLLVLSEQSLSSPLALQPPLRGLQQLPPREEREGRLRVGAKPPLPASHGRRLRRGGGERGGAQGPEDDRAQVSAPALPAAPRVFPTRLFAISRCLLCVCDLFWAKQRGSLLFVWQRFPPLGVDSSLYC